MAYSYIASYILLFFIPMKRL